MSRGLDGTAPTPAAHEDELRRVRLEYPGEVVEEVLRDDLVDTSYQPIVDLRHLEVSGWEALLRCTHPSFGHLDPEAVVRAATRIGMLDELTLRTADQALSAVARAAALTRRRLSVAVNVELAQLTPDNDAVRGIAERAAADDVTLVVEITERGPDVWSAENEDASQTLASAGVTVALDDYGTGAARLAFLHQRDWDLIKMDRSHLDHGERRHQIIFSNIARMLHELSIPTVAEGVENEQQLDFVRRHPIAYAQGYWLGRPEPAARMLARVRERGLEVTGG